MKYVMTEAVAPEGMALLDQSEKVYVAHDANPANLQLHSRIVNLISGIFSIFLTTHFLHVVMLIAAKILFYFNKYYFFCIFLSDSRFE